MATSGDLLLTGCIDWDNMGSAKPMGLEVPHLIRLKSPVTKVFSSSSSAHLFLTLTTGELYALGNNTRGQLGLGDKLSRSYPVQVKVREAVGSESDSGKVVKVATGKAHSLIVMSDGLLYGCGANNFGQLGMGSSVGSMADKDTLRRVPGGEHVQDIACGAEHSLYCTWEGDLYSFGHPEHGVLGNGSSGEVFKEGSKKPGLSWNFVYRPQKVEIFCAKDSKGKITGHFTAASIKVRSVAAGKHHSMCLEDWKGESVNRVFTWGFGGYGRLGHNSADDESTPRELTMFSRSMASMQVREIFCGGTYSCALSVSENFYFWGKLPNSPRGESQTYPKMQPELLDFGVHAVGAGSQFIVVASDDVCIGWGKPVGGKLGLEGGATASTTPKYVERVKFLRTLSISCGLGHCAFVVDAEGSEQAKATLTACPMLKEPPASELIMKAAAPVKKGRPKSGGGDGDQVKGGAKKQKK